MQFAIDFFKKVVEAKLKSEDITQDWYKTYFGNTELFKPDEITINFGLNKKTITNMYNTASKDVVLEASAEHYDSFLRLLENLLMTENDIDLLLNIKFRGVSAELNLNESLLVINTLAVKRAALRGGLWSEAGKNVEKLLVVTLCKLFGVSDEHFSANPVGKVSRKVKKGSDEQYVCHQLLLIRSVGTKSFTNWVEKKVLSCF